MVFILAHALVGSVFSKNSLCVKFKALKTDTSINGVDLGAHALACSIFS